jgi:hypothetical protein
MAYGYQAILELEGEEPIKLEHCSYTFARDINEKTGEIESGVSGGTIALMYIDCPSKAILEWGMKYKLKNGSIKLKQTDSETGTYVPEEEVKLCKAACVTLELNYSRYGTSHFITQLTITSDENKVGASSETVSNKWKLI